MKKLAINFENVLTVKKELNKPLNEVFNLLKSSGISALDIMYDRVKNNEYYSDILSAGFTINTVFHVSDLGVKNNFSKELEIVDFCANRNIKRIFLITKQNAFDKDSVYKKNIIQNLRRIVKYASNYNIVITIENFGNESSPFSTINNLLDYLKSVKGLGLTLDIGNFLLAGEKPYHSYERLKEYVSNVHLKDRGIVDNNERFVIEDISGNKTSVLPLGKGQCEIGKIVNDIIKSGINCDYCLEFDFKSDKIFEDCKESAMYFFTELN